MGGACAWRRRDLLPLMAAGLFGGCGFRPLYGTALNGAPGPAAQGLAEITVGLIPERTGQLLHQALQERFERNGLAVPHRYDLTVSLAVSATAIAIQQDTSNTRLRYVGVATYTLVAQDPARGTLLSGTARSVDGLNIFDQELFAASLEGDVVQRRIVEDVADQIALQLAAYFDKVALAAKG